MESIKLLSILVSLCAMMTACDDVNERAELSESDEVRHERAVEVEIRGFEDFQQDQGDGPLFTEDLSLGVSGAQGPAGQCCWVRCGGTGYYENLWWVQHNCNGVGWDWCAGHYGTSLINAEWWRC